MSITEQMIYAWAQAVLRPALQSAMVDGVKLNEIGSALIGFGIGCCRRAGLNNEEIRSQIFEAALADKR